MYFECARIVGDMKCGNQSFWVDGDTKQLVCIKCRNKTPIMSFFADIKNAAKQEEVPTVPIFANSQCIEEGPIDAVEVTQPIKTQRDKFLESIREEITEEGD